MLVFMLFSTVILNVECATICNICDCQANIDLVYVSVNCSSRENVFKDKLLPTNTFSLDLSGNNLTTIEPSNFFQSETLKELYINKNSLIKIESGSFQIPNLKLLDLSENELDSLNPDLFNETIRLEYLNLANNKFTSLSNLNFSCLVNLKEIILDNNNIGLEIEAKSLFTNDGYGLPLKIQSLSISGVNLNHLDLDYFNPVNRTLKNLIISNNNLENIIKLPENLEYLDISNNPIKNITSSDFPWYYEYIYLRVLKLNNLSIEEIPNNAFSSIMLTDLELADNKNLKVFSNLTFGRQLLIDSYDFMTENLTLKGTNLSTLDEGLSVLFQRVKRLDLQKNPWICDCRLAWIRDLPIADDLTEDLRCTLPPMLYNKRIFELNRNDFTCPKTWGVSVVGVTIGLIMYTLLVIVTLAWIYVFIYKQKPNVNRQEYSRI